MDRASAATWAAFWSLAGTFAVLYGYGVVIDPIADEFGVGRGSAAALPAMASFILFSIGPITGRVADTYGTQTVVAAGAIALAAGVGIMTTTETYVVALMAFGLGVGFPCGLVYVPAVAHIAASPDARTPRRVGITVAGVGFGTAFGGWAVSALADRVGWRSAYGWFALASAAVLLVAALAFRASPVARDVEIRLPSLRGLAASPLFRRHYLAMTLMTPSLFMGLVFVASYGEDQGWSASRSSALLGIIGLAGVAGRLGLALAAERIQPLAIYRGCFAVLAMSCVIWTFAGSSYPAMLVYAAVMGSAYGGFVGVAPLVAADAFGREGLGGTLGALYTAIGIGGLLTGPVASAAIDRVGYPSVLLTIGGLVVAAGLVVPTRSGVRTAS